MSFKNGYETEMMAQQLPEVPVGLPRVTRSPEGISKTLGKIDGLLYEWGLDPELVHFLGINAQGYFEASASGEPKFAFWPEGFPAFRMLYLVEELNWPDGA